MVKYIIYTIVSLELKLYGNNYINRIINSRRILMIGLISDTHSLLRQEVVDNLNDCNLIIHAGDIGKYEVIENLSKICNVEFIRGNCDKDKDIAKEERMSIYNNIYILFF